MNPLTKPFKKKLYLLSLVCCLTLVGNKLYAQGPNAPEAASFEPVDATDMVNLVTGDLSYVLPLLNVPSPEGGYPIALSYHAGIAMEQEASWVGLGWSLNPGAINRSVNGYPDDWQKTRVSELFYDEGGSTNYYSFSIGGTLPNGLTIGVSKSWGGYRAWGGVVGFAGQSVNFGSEGIGMGISVGPLSYNGTSNGSGSVGLSYTPSGINTDTGKPKNLNGFGVGFNLDFDSNSFIATGYSKKAGLGISFNSNMGGSFSINGNNASIQSSSASHNDYYVKTKDKGFNVNAGFFWVSYRHRKVSYSLFKDNIITPSGILNAFDFRMNNSVPYDSKILRRRMMDIKEYYADDDDYANYVHNEYEFSNEPAISLPNYDNYSVSAQGLGGTISPRIFDEITLVGKNFWEQNDGYSSGNNTVVQVNYFEDNFSNQGQYVLGNKINFYFDNVNSSFLRTNTGVFDLSQLGSRIDNDVEAKSFNTITNSVYSSSTTIDGYLKNVGNRKRDGNYIETFTNKNIIDGNTNGWFIDAKTESFYRGESPFIYTNKKNEEGIGAYRITTPDGKVYHYSLPVYHYESIFKNFPNNNDEDSKFFQSKKVTPYATHWLLTAITGPDYVDKNSNGELDDEDYGYWVEFEYGRWSDGSGYKTPREGYKSTGNNYTYFKGVKEIYYLDQIRTRTHTALFVKSLRKDNKSFPIQKYNQKWSGNINDPIWSETYSKYLYDNEFKNYNLYGDYHVKTIYTQQPYKDVTYSNQPFNSSKKYTTTYMDIPQSYSLKLDKILVLKNEDVNYDKTIINALSNDRNVGVSYHNAGYTGYPEQPFVNQIAALPINSPIPPNTYYSNNDNYVLDKYDIDGLGLEAKAVKTVIFNYDYSLSGNLPNGLLGLLTLKNISIVGKQSVALIPPYSFSYSKPNLLYNKDNQDVWGYVNNNPDAWSLNKIITPLGSEIEIEYEPDSFYTEAAYRTSGTYQKFQFKALDYPGIDEDNNIIDWQKGEDYIEFYFDTNKVNNLSQVAVIGSVVEIGISKRDYYYDFFNNKVYRSQPLHNSYTISNVNSNSIKFVVNQLTDIDKHQQLVELECPLLTSNNYPYNPPTENDFCIQEINFSLDSGYFTYNNANGKTGGGIRVKNIFVNEGSNSYVTNYDYNNPVSNTISGITSYEPFDDENKVVPYIQELPAPNVLYGNVTVKNVTNNVADKLTLYTFKTLTPFNLSDNEDLLYSLGDDFKVVKEQYNALPYSGQYESSPVSEAAGHLIYKHTIHNSLSNIGNLLSIKSYNYKNQQLSVTYNNYKRTNHNEENHHNGITQESFITRKKRQRNFDHSSTGSLWTDRTYNIGSSSMIKYPSVLESTTNVKGGFKTTTYFNKYDFLTGQVLETSTVDSKGNERITELRPAYIIPEYSDNLSGYGMGSKVDDPTNYNMLTQEAMTKSYLKVGGTWKETGVGITTWNNQWDYINDNGGKTLNSAIPNNQKIWRKHKTFVWDGDLKSDGTLNGFTNSNPEDDDESFVWTVGQSVAQTNPEWKNISTTTLYDHYSMPLEVQDINGNYAATKTCDDDSKVLAVSNAKYTEMYYSGAEYVTSNTAYFDGQVKASTTNTTKAHTGLRSIAIASGAKGFEVNMLSGEHRSGKYKISVWVEKPNHSNARIHINGSPKAFNGEEIFAGNWVLKTHYEDLSSGAETVYVTSNSGTVYFDDFRLHPIASSMTGYVYNEWDELWYIIGNNGLASKFEYDKAGRLIKTYKEVADFNGSGTGGFKQVSENNYNYKKPL